MLKPAAAARKDAIGLHPLQHRHFATIAKIISEIPSASDRYNVSQHFAGKLKATNPRFDATRFLAACEA